MIGLVLLLATLFLPKLLGGGGGVVGGERAAVRPIRIVRRGRRVRDRDRADRVRRRRRRAAVLGGRNFPASFDTQYEPADTVFFGGFIDTGCGQASSEVGPFYCPLDSLVYFDLDFLLQLQDQFGATGDLAAQYIVAHEYGHHVQNVLGINARVQQAQAERS